MLLGKAAQILLFAIVISWTSLMMTEVSGSELKPIILSGSYATKNGFNGKALELIYTEAFKRLGYKLTYIGYPAKRSSALSDLGHVDGEIHRVNDYGKTHPNVIRVEESPFSIIFMAYGVDGSLQLNGWKSLQGGDYLIGHRLGVRKTDGMLPKFVAPNNLQRVSSVELGLKMVIGGRIKIYIDIKENIEGAISADSSLRLSELRPLGIMEEVTIHAFLHKKHEALVPQLSLVLKQMKKEGIIEKFISMRTRIQ